MRKAAAVRLRKLTCAERVRLGRKLRDLRLPARTQPRVSHHRGGSTAPSVAAAAAAVGCHFTVAYDWVHRFNPSGFTTFEVPSNLRGRVPVITSEQLRALVDVALSSPRERGLPFTVWSVPKLAAYCRENQLIPPFCDEWVRRLSRGAGFSAQRIRTWKTSHDPAFDREKKPSGPSMRAGRRGRSSSASMNGGRSS